MASRLDLGAALCGQDPRPGTVPLRDDTNPLVLTEGMLKVGYTLEAVEKLLLAYYSRDVNVQHVDVPIAQTVESSVVSGTTRSIRSMNFFSRCDEWIAKPGYCYTTIIRPSQRERLAAVLGAHARLNDLFRLSAGDVAWGKLSDIYVVRNDNWNVHLTFEKQVEKFDAHLAAFAADFPTMVPKVWRDSLSNVKPVQESWFGMTTRFGGVFRRESTPSIEEKSFRRFTYHRGLNTDVDTGQKISVDSDSVVHIRLPQGAVLRDKFVVWEEAGDGPVSMLVRGPVCWDVVGVSLNDVIVEDYEGGIASLDELAADADRIALQVSSSFSLVKDQRGNSFERFGRMNLSSHRATDDVQLLRRFGYPVVADAISKVRVLYQAPVVPVSSSNYDIAICLGSQTYNCELEIPMGTIVSDGNCIVADATECPVSVLVKGDARFFLFGIDAEGVSKKSNVSELPYVQLRDVLSLARVGVVDNEVRDHDFKGGFVGCDTSGVVSLHYYRCIHNDADVEVLRGLTSRGSELGINPMTVSCLPLGSTKRSLFTSIAGNCVHAFPLYGSSSELTQYMQVTCESLVRGDGCTCGLSRFGYAEAVIHVESALAAVLSDRQVFVLQDNEIDDCEYFIV